MALELSENALRVLEKRYLKKDKEGRVIESPEEMFRRVAKAVAAADKFYGRSKSKLAKSEEEFYAMMSNLEFTPNSPTLMNAGRELGQLSACFVVEINDSMESIFEAVKNIAMIHKSGGGTGMDFSRLRPRGSRVRSTDGISSGPVSFMKVFNAATQAVKQGGCVDENTIISTEKGLLPIKELCYVSAGKYQNLYLKVFTDDGLKIAEQFYNNGIKPVKTIITKDGYRFTATLNHKIRIIDEDGNYLWRELKDIRRGDWIALQMDTFKGEKILFPKFEKVFHFNAKLCNLPSEMTVGLAELIGYFIGDGCFHKGKLTLAVPHDSLELRGYFDNFMKEAFKITSRIEQKPNDKSINLIYHSQMLVEWLKFIGVDKIDALHACIPQIILEADKEYAEGFLRGLFEADGYISKEGYHVALCSVSSNLIHQAQVLLLSLGIPSNIRVNSKRASSFGKNNLYILTISTPKGLHTFKEKIGFLSKGKKVRLDQIIKREVSYNDIIPNQSRRFREFYENIVLKPRNKFYRKIWHYLSGIKNDRNLTRQRAETLVEEYDFLEESFLGDILRRNQYYDQVEEIFYSQVRTLDLVVPDGHTYIANGFVSHNTRRGANMGILRVDHPDILEFITCKENDKEITNFNISVAVTDEFMRKLEKGEDYDIVDPNTKKVVKRLNAKEVFELIVKMAHKNGEPGIIFIDKMNEFNPTPKLGRYESTNPCITKDSLIPTQRGLMQMGELVKDYPYGGIGILNSIGFFSPTRIFRTGRKEVFCIKTKAGYELKATANHPILTTRGWIKVEDLHLGQDKIHIQNKAGVFSDNRKLPFMVIKEFYGRNGRFYKANLPDQWSEELGILLGWLIGDGNLHGSSESVFFYFGKDDKDALSIIQKIIKDIYGREAVLSDRGGEWRLSINSKLLFKFFNMLGVRRLRAHQKSVPQSIFTAPEDVIKGFLRGLFSSDGINYIEGKSAYVRLPSSSLKLLKEIQLLLLNLGIFSRIYQNRKKSKKGPFKHITKKGIERVYNSRPYHELEVSRKDVITFIKEIGFLGNKNKEKINKLLKKSKRLRGYYKRERYDLITSINSIGIEDVYDLTEPMTHSFIANGFVIHNCGEQILLPYESCNLGSINLSKMAKKLDGEYQIDWDRLKRTVHSAVHFLDNVIDVNRFPLKEIAEKTKLTRKIGLGVMGWASLLLRLGIPYNSDEAVALAEKIMSFILEEARKKSCAMAKERGVFPAFKDSVFDCPGAVRQRNATLTTIAPTGTISIIAGPCSSGIEPLFAISYFREVMDKDRLIEIDPLFEETAKGRGFWSKELMEKIAERGSIQSFTEIPEDIKRIFVTAHDISPEWHIKMQAAFQKYTHNAVSKTINFPHSATIEDVRKSYLLAYKLGCKGVTIYRDRSREEQVLNIAYIKEHPEPGKISPRPRPEITTGTTTKIATGCGNLYVTINCDKEGKPFEVFTQMGKAGGCAASQLEAIGRLVSLAFRSGIEVRSIIDQLHGIRCPSPSWEKGKRIFSCADAIARVIEKSLVDIPEKSAATSDKTESKGPVYESAGLASTHQLSANIVGVCPDCGGALRHEEGCIKCLACGFSKC